MRKTITFEGLKVRPSYEELISILDKPLDLKHPDRKASQMRNSHWLSQLDGDSYRAMDELHHNMLKELEKEGILKSYASSHNVSLASLRSHHLAPSEHSEPSAHTQFVNLTPPPSPRHQHSQTESPSPRNQYSQTVSRHQHRHQQTELIQRHQHQQTEVLPEVQQHYQQVPEAPRQSKNIKVKSKIEKKEEKKEIKFKTMHDSEFDDKIKQQHEMNVDDAEMQQKRADLKKEFKDLLPNLNDNEIDKMVKKQRMFSQGAKRPSEPASSSTQPAARVRTKRDKGEKRDAESEPIPRAKAKVKTNPALDNPESVHPKRLGRPPNKSDSSSDEVEIQGVVLNHEKTQSYWKKQSANEIRAQLVLRNIPRSRTGFAKKPELLNLIKDLVKNNKW